MRKHYFLNQRGRPMDRKSIHKFLIKARGTPNYFLSAQDLENIISFLGINALRLASFIGVDRSTLTNISKGKRASKLLTYTILDTIEKELIFYNYFKSKFSSKIECKLDEYYYELLVKRERDY